MNRMPVATAEMEMDAATGPEAEGARRATGAAGPVTTSGATDPDPEVPAKVQRRRFTAEYRLRIVKQADACKKPGELGTLLRREGLYASHVTTWRRQGIDAPICQDTPSGGLDDLLTSAEVGHDALVDLSREEAFQAADDVAFGPASGEASGDVVAGRLVELHPDDDGAIEGRVGVSVAASIEAVPTGGHPRRGRDRAGAAELREGGLRTNPIGVIAEDDQQLSRGVGAHTEALAEGRRCRGGETREVLVVQRDFLGERHPPTGERPEGVLGGRAGRVDGARSESGAAREQAVIGEIVEGFSQDGRGLHEDLLQRVHRRGARFHGGIPCDLELADHLDGAVRGLGDGRRLPREQGPRRHLGVDGVGLAGGASCTAVAPIHFHDMMPGSADGPCQASAVAPGAFDPERLNPPVCLGPRDQSLVATRVRYERVIVQTDPPAVDRHRDVDMLMRINTDDHRPRFGRRNYAVGHGLASSDLRPRAGPGGRTGL